MKQQIMIFIAIAAIHACGPRTSSTDSEVTESPMAGVFVRGSDTLKVEKDLSSFIEEIDFDIYAANENVTSYVFNTANFAEGDENSEKYAFKDSSEITYTDLIFTYSYDQDNWTIEDLGFPVVADTLPKISLTGTYKRME